MNFAAVKPLCDALLYEGYLLYPYRPSALKNRQRCLIGSLVPALHSAAFGGAEPSSLRSECLVEASAAAELALRVRFLHLLICSRPGPEDELEEANERQVEVAPIPFAQLARDGHRQPFAFAGGRLEASEASELAAAPSRVAREHQTIEGAVEVSAAEVGPGVYKLSVSVHNLSPLPAPGDAAGGRLRTLVSAHVLLGVRGGAFVSLLEPPPALEPLAAGCRQRGAWPVLVGEPGARDLLLCAPIILYDHPALAPESPGDLFDGTEIDEMLRLRILTLTPDEQREALRGDARARRLLEQTAQLSPDDMLRLHGAQRDPRLAAAPARVRAAGVELGPGDRVRLRPRGRSDVMDLALAGRAATVASIEQDFEEQLFLTVVLDDDPGRDLGLQGQPGHRFFFRPDEVEPLAAAPGGAS